MDLTKFALSVVENVRLFVQPALDAIDKRIDALQGIVGELRAEKEAKEAAFKSILEDREALLLENKNRAELQFIDSTKTITDAIASIPVHVANAIDADESRKKGIREEIDSAVRAAIDAIPKAQDGRSVTLDEVAPLVHEIVAKAVAGLPLPKDGVSGKDGIDGINGKDGAPGERGEKGADGADGKSVTAAEVVAELQPEIAKWALDFERRAHETLERALDRMPKAKDGKDGADGLGFDDIEQIDDPLEYGFRFKRGDRIIEHKWQKPTIADRYCGVWKQDNYARGCLVTWGGSIWLAKRDTTSKPETDDSWVLIVKRGQNGSNGKDGRPYTPPSPVRIKP